MIRDFSISAFSMGLLAAFVGFSSSFAIILAGLTAVGASPAQAASGLMFSSVAMGLCGIWFAVKYRMPIGVAWSTPGAAFLVSASTMQGGFAEAVGGMIMCAVLIMVSGIIRPLSRTVEKIPKSLANAMLAGILMTLCIMPAKALGEMPLLAGPIVVAWVIGFVWNRFWAVPLALAAFILVVVFGLDFPQGASAILGASLIPQPEFVAPIFTWAGAISIALPLYIVTMAGQNIPGLTVLAANNFVVKAGPLIRDTGLFSLVAAPFCALPSNLSAITSTMMCGEDAHPEPNRRYWTVIICSIAHVLAGLLAGTVATFVSFAPPLLVASIAGLALIPAMINSLKSSFADETVREAAALTFLITVSGMSLFAISGAFWGLLVGGAMYWLTRRKTSG